MRGILPGDSPSKAKKADDGNIIEEYSVDASLFRPKTYHCKVCDREFEYECLKSGKAQSDGYDLDLRPRFKNLDITLYRIVRCPHCGYTDIDEFFSKLKNSEAAAIKAKSQPSSEELPVTFAERNFENTYPLYRAALRDSLLGGVKVSRRAYIALYTAWLIRAWREEKEKNGITVSPSDPMSIEMENKLLKYTFQNFNTAADSEIFPICGIKEDNFYYLQAALAYKLGDFKNSYYLVRSTLKDRSAPLFLRRKAEDLVTLLKKARPSS